jgi:regulator of PEP synthase PpsR (kinase-PPPase family)
MSQATTTSKAGRRRSPELPVSGNVYLISDSSVDLQSEIVEAFRLQYPAKSLTVRVEPFVHTMERLTEILSRARREKAATFHVFMSVKLRKSIAAYCKRYGLPCCDLIGVMFDFLSSFAGHGSPLPDLAPRRRGRAAKRQSTVVSGYD